MRLKPNFFIFFICTHFSSVFFIPLHSLHFLNIFLHCSSFFFSFHHFLSFSSFFLIFSVLFIFLHVYICFFFPFFFDFFCLFFFFIFTYFSFFLFFLENCVSSFLFIFLMNKCRFKNLYWCLTKDVSSVVGAPWRCGVVTLWVGIAGIRLGHSLGREHDSTPRVERRLLAC